MRENRRRRQGTIQLCFQTDGPISLHAGACAGQSFRNIFKNFVLNCNRESQPKSRCNDFPLATALNSLRGNQSMWPGLYPLYDKSSSCRWSTTVVNQKSVSKHCSASSCGTSHAGHEITSDPCDETPSDLIQAACGLSST